MARKIDKIIIHHSISPQNLSIEASSKSFSDNHKTRMNQPPTMLDIPYKHCAYHYLINGYGELMQTRHIDEIGYHASNWDVNKTSIGICFTGNFDVDILTQAQKDRCVLLLSELKQLLGRVSIHGHNEYAPKTCPGKNVNIKELDELSNKSIGTAVQSVDFNIIREEDVDAALERHIFCYNLSAVQVLFSLPQKIQILDLLDKKDIARAEEVAEFMYDHIMTTRRKRTVNR